MEKRESDLVLVLAGAIVFPPLGLLLWRRAGADVGRWPHALTVLWVLQLGLTWLSLPAELRGAGIPGVALAGLIGTMWVAGLLLRAKGSRGAELAHRTGYSVGLVMLALLPAIPASQSPDLPSPKVILAGILAVAWAWTFNRFWASAPWPAWPRLKEGAEYAFAVIAWALATGAVALLLLGWMLVRGPR